MNTKLGLMYRDANNYKTYEEVVLRGEITRAQIEQVSNKLDELHNDFNVIAEQIGLPTPSFLGLGQGWPSQEEDHVYTTLTDFEDAYYDAKDCPRPDDMLTDEAVNIDMHVDEFVHRMLSVLDWDVRTEWDRMIQAGEDYNPFELTPKSYMDGPAVKRLNPVETTASSEFSIK